MKKVLSCLACLTVGILVISCTPQERAKEWGGTADIDLPKGKKLITLTWKEDHVWYLTREMNQSDSAETYQFSESSSYGVLNGTLNVVEHK